MAKSTHPRVELPPNGIKLREYMRAIERQLVEQAVKRSASQTEAAKLLGMTQPALWIKLQRMRSQSLK